MLKIILGKNISNILVVVTRYFGGILLGTGGLVRAYSAALEEALSKTEIVKKARGYEVKVSIEYKHLESLKYYLEKMNIKIINIEYLEEIEVTIEILKEKMTLLENNGKFILLKQKIVNEKFVEI